MARLISVNVALPRDIAWQGKTVHTAVWKTSVQGRRMVRRLNIEGDGQGDLAGHGGGHRAVFIYQIDSYRYWQNHLVRSDFTFGEFEEHFTVEGLSDDEVCIGDHLPYRERCFRGDATARHLLPDRHSHERATNGRAARPARQARLLLPCPRRGRGRGWRLGPRAIS
jgi:hypothetical protein